MQDDSLKPAQALRRLIDGYQLSQAIHVAATVTCPLQPCQC
ncbi:hypothetical protein [Variovorax sp. JS1663]|nr:hypothetical protein [Variovorax sp. JS1663]